MKFVGAIIVYLIMAGVISWGILLTFTGNFWVLIAGLVAYIIALVRIGCNPPAKAH